MFKEYGENIVIVISFAAIVLTIVTIFGIIWECLYGNLESIIEVVKVTGFSFIFFTIVILEGFASKYYIDKAFEEKR